MKTSRSNNLGFAHLAIPAVIIVLGIIGFVGWYVWNAKEKTNTSTKTTAENKTQQIKESSESKNWTKYTFKTASASIKIPDGWAITALRDSEDASFETLYSPTYEGIRFMAGTAATVTESYKRVNSEGEPGALYIYFSDRYEAGDKQPISLTSASGKKIDKYTRIATADSEGVSAHETGTKTSICFV